MSWSKQKHGKHSDGLPPGHSNEVERATIALCPIKVSLDMTSPTILWNIRLQDYIRSETDWQWSRPKETKLPVSPECSMLYQLEGGEEWWMMNEKMNIPIPGTQPLPLFKTKQKFTRQKWYYGAGAIASERLVQHMTNRTDSTCVYMNTTFNGSTGPRTVYTISKYIYIQCIPKEHLWTYSISYFRCSRPSCVLHSPKKKWFGCPCKNQWLYRSEIVSEVKKNTRYSKDFLTIKLPNRTITHRNQARAPHYSCVHVSGWVPRTRMRLICAAKRIKDDKVITPGRQGTRGLLAQQISRLCDQAVRTQVA